MYRFFVSSDTILQLCYIVLTKIITPKINIQKGAWIMKYILMRTVSGKTYYARTEENNAIKKTEDIALAQRFASEKDAKKMRDRASRKLNGYKIHPVSDESQKALRDSKIHIKKYFARHADDLSVRISGQSIFVVSCIFSFCRK